ncbi:MAG: PAS domain-containing sensor histidine kinase [Candidatus Thorarchaeota archaeon]|nr:PAS domain-containing sensor histidine kinase [Candidatus Thorarchaeota archaeon]MCK5238430.1 PAS domain-containing sensor histidine kinase [Candidatus Thorarchaeota archaeon]
MVESDDAANNPEWESIFQAIGHPTIILDKNHRILMVNRATTEMLKKSPEEIVGHQCYEIFHESGEPACGCPLESLLESGELETNEMVMEVFGSKYLVSCTPDVNEDGELERIIHIATDISARFRAEEELEAVLDIMGHDLRNRLQAALLGAEILGDTCRGTESIEAIDVIISSVGSLGDLIEKVQATRGFLNVPVSETSLDEVTMQAVKILKYRHPNTIINMDITVSGAMIMADAFLENLLLNLLENGIIHNTSKKKQLWVSLKEEKDGYVVSIGDNGPGIPDYMQGSLFDAERRFGGVGIHQSVRIAKKYNGRISLKNRVDDDASQGSEFNVYIPAV